MDDLEELILAIVRNNVDKIYTSIPAEVVEYDEKQFAKVKPLIEIDGLTLEPISSVPVHHSGGNWLVATQIDVGTEGMLNVCMRDISKWLFPKEKQSKRKFSLSDGYFIPGVRSESGSIPNLENNGCQLRNRDGSSFLWLKNDGTSHCSGDFFCGGNLHVAKTAEIKDELTVSSTITASDDIFSKGEVVTRISHKHPYIDSKGSSATPVPSLTSPAQQK